MILAKVVRTALEIAARGGALVLQLARLAFRAVRRIGDCQTTQSRKQGGDKQKGSVDLLPHCVVAYLQVCFLTCRVQRIVECIFTWTDLPSAGRVYHVGQGQAPMGHTLPRVRW